ncbi:ATP-binding protein [Temperatibacter marinus]|uniref:histidine kinase n=1 Tax=Temperatibacter marinus TaxID=1456591 RepID=A0AA52HB57_9PROT|nr:ATP-binding protein [Temperatibacter marinus]WND03425.1 ATP-binding protein [Temperatibacter marinus]
MSIKNYLNTLDDRLLTGLIWIGLIILWSFETITTFALLLIGSCVTFFIFQHQSQTRKLVMRYRKRKSRSKKSRIKKGAMKLRAKALNNIPTPILIISDGLTISFANQAAEEIVGQDLSGKDLFLYVRQPAIVTAVTEAVTDKVASDNNLRFTTADDRSFDVSVQPISKQSGVRNGRAIVFFYEVTRLLKTERMRVDFVANASHELRTPLSSILGFIETLQGPAKGDSAAAERFLGIMQKESERMARLIEDLLSLSRIEMERHTTPTEAVNIATLIKNIVHSITPKAAERQITFKINCAEDLPFVMADSDQILQVLINLASNAAKYANENSVVHIGAAHRKNKSVTIYVKDEGPGIEPEHLVRLTERFYRVDTARSRQMGGTGLGLAIVKHILLRHSSRLEIMSEFGKGTTFSFDLDATKTSD